MVLHELWMLLVLKLWLWLQVLSAILSPALLLLGLLLIGLLQLVQMLRALLIRQMLRLLAGLL